MVIYHLNLDVTNFNFVFNFKNRLFWYALSGSLQVYKISLSVAVNASF